PVARRVPGDRHLAGGFSGLPTPFADSLAGHGLPNLCLLLWFSEFTPVAPLAGTHGADHLSDRLGQPLVGLSLSGRLVSQPDPGRLVVDRPGLLRLPGVSGFRCFGEASCPDAGGPVGQPQELAGGSGELPAVAGGESPPRSHS